MTHSLSAEPFSAAEMERRQESILGRPPRLGGLPPEARSKRQQDLFDEMSTVVADGVRKPRESMAALEILIRHAELYLMNGDRT